MCACRVSERHADGLPLILSEPAPRPTGSNSRLANHLPTASLELPFASHDGISAMLDTLAIMDFSHWAPYAQEKAPHGFGGKEVSWLPMAGTFD